MTAPKRQEALSIVAMAGQVVKAPMAPEGHRPDIPFHLHSTTGHINAEMHQPRIAGGRAEMQLTGFVVYTFIREVPEQPAGPRKPGVVYPD